MVWGVLTIKIYAVSVPYMPGSLVLYDNSKCKTNLCCVVAPLPPPPSQPLPPSPPPTIAAAAALAAALYVVAVAALDTVATLLPPFVTDISYH